VIGSDGIGSYNTHTSTNIKKNTNNTSVNQIKYLVLKHKTVKWTLSYTNTSGEF
jgi:hypothetical protein